MICMKKQVKLIFNIKRIDMTAVTRLMLDFTVTNYSTNRDICLLP